MPDKLDVLAIGRAASVAREIEDSGVSDTLSLSIDNSRACVFWAFLSGLARMVTWSPTLKDSDVQPLRLNIAVH